MYARPLPGKSSMTLCSAASRACQVPAGTSNHLHTPALVLLPLLALAACTAEKLQADKEKRRRIEDELRDPKNFLE